MNFNHLLESKYLKRNCGTSNQECYYIPAGNTRATAGEHVHLTLVCKRCGKRNDIFLTKEEYFIQERLIHKEIGDV